MEIRRNKTRDETTIVWTAFNKLMKKESKKDLRTYKNEVILKT